MDDDDHYGSAAHWLLLGLAMLLILGTVLVSARPITLGNVPDVLPVADIPATADTDQLRRFVWATNYEIPRTRIRPQIAAAIGGPTIAETGPPKLGYSIRQVSFLGLPLFAYREIGFVLYLDDRDSFRMAPLGEDGLALLGKRLDTELGKDWIFPVWIVAWGWIGPLLVAGFGLLEWRRQRRRRADLGLM